MLEDRRYLMAAEAEVPAMAEHAAREIARRFNADAILPDGWGANDTYHRALKNARPVIARIRSALPPAERG